MVKTHHTASSVLFRGDVKIHHSRMAIGKVPSQFCEMFAKVTNWVTNPFKSFCERFGKVCGKREGIILFLKFVESSSG